MQFVPIVCSIAWFFAIKGLMYPHLEFPQIMPYPEMRCTAETSGV